MRRIAHLDMDAFYASVELLRYPQLSGLPVVIGGRKRLGEEVVDLATDLKAEQFPRLKNYVGRGVITTSTYAARGFGVGSGMGLMKAAQLCPEAILLPVDFVEIKRYSSWFKRLILEHASVMEDRGIDEVYIDFTEAKDGQEEGGRVLAARIQRAIFEATKLTCSIGVAPNKLIAKMASEFEKPNGISIIYSEDFARLIKPLPCRKINGIGPKNNARLLAENIETIGQLAVFPLEKLVALFGKVYGKWLHESANGRDERPLTVNREAVSVSRETTFESDLRVLKNRAELTAILQNLCARVSHDLRQKSLVGQTIGIKIRYADYKSVTRDVTLATPTDAPEIIRQAARNCLKRVDLNRPFRLLGVRVAKLVDANKTAQAEIKPRPTQLSFEF